GRRSETRTLTASAPATRFRIPRPNETRAIGNLTAVDCESGRIVLHVETDDESLRLSTASVAAIQFISYKATDPKPLACGEMSPPARVFATYQQSEAAIQATG